MLYRTVSIEILQYGTDLNETLNTVGRLFTGAQKLNLKAATLPRLLGEVL